MIHTQRVVAGQGCAGIEGQTGHDVVSHHLSKAEMTVQARRAVVSTRAATVVTRAATVVAAVARWLGMGEGRDEARPREEARVLVGALVVQF